MNRNRMRKQARRDGKIALVVGVTLLMMVALAAVLGNTGHAVKEKLEVQNAADATALAATEQMARGMNALTTTNHVVGETTAMVVILEALGGPEVDVKIQGNPPQTKAIDGVIRSIGNKAAVTGLPVWVPPPVHQADARFLDTIVKLIVGKSSNDKKHTAFATIYDAKTTLKRQLVKQQLIKLVANGGLMVPPPWGVFVAPVAYAAHGYATYEILQIAKEWLILEALEKMVNAPPIKKLKRTVETKIIPAMAKNGDLISGYDPGKKSGSRRTSSGTPKTARPPKQTGGIVSETVAAARKRMGDQLTSTTFLSPHSEKLRMPVEPEPAPRLKGLAPGESWGKEPTLASVVTPMDIYKMQKDLDDAQDELDDNEDKVKNDLRRLDQAERLIQQRLISADLDPEAIRKDAEAPNQTEEQRQEIEEQIAEANQEREKLEQELVAIAESRKLRQKALKEINEGQAKMAKERPEMDKAMQELLKLPQQGGNPSPKHLPQKLTIGEERHTQWVRASYPYVDAVRSGMLTTMRRHMKRSKTADHFIKWSDRYTLVKAWQFRSGYRFQKQGGSQSLKGTWVKKANAKPMTLYVMKGTYRKDPRGSRRNSQPIALKGYEAWTGQDRRSQQLAEDLFVITAIAHRDYEPSFNSNVFPAGTETGVTAFAQAILYNANPQEPAPPSNSAQSQPPIGWDTLNWDAAAATPEWGSEPNESEKSIWPWELFDAMGEEPSIAVKLNWQAKLVPVTESKMNKVFNDMLRQGVGQLLSNKEQAEDIGINLGTVRALPHKYIHH